MFHCDVMGLFIYKQRKGEIGNGAEQTGKTGTAAGILPDIACSHLHADFYPALEIIRLFLRR